MTKDILVELLEKVFILSNARSKNSDGDEHDRCMFIVESTEQILTRLERKDYSKNESRT